MGFRSSLKRAGVHAPAGVAMMRVRRASAQSRQYNLGRVVRPNSHSIRAGLNSADIKDMLQRAAHDCAQRGMAPADARYDPGAVIAAARDVDATLVDTSKFMDAYASSLRSAIINGVEVCK